MGHKAGDAGGLLRGYRRAAGVSQRQLAEAAGISIGVIRDLEQGRTGRLGTGSLRALVWALGLSADRAGEFAFAARGRPRHAVAAAGDPASLQLLVLGPVTAWRGSTEVDLGPSSQRALLGLLAVSAGEPVHRDRFIDLWWGDDPPASAVNQVQAWVSRLRRILDPGRPARGTGALLVTTGNAYRLTASAGQLDLLAFHDLAARGEAALHAGRLAAACGWYEKALNLWRGDPLCDIDTMRQHPAVVGLSRLRSTVIVSYAGAACELGCYDQVLPLLWPLAEGEPLHERAHAMLMLALAGTGRQAMALKVFEDLRRRLDEQLGVGPCAELAGAHMRVLRADLPAARRLASTRGAARAGPGAAVAGAAVVPRQLPAAIGHFAGRRAELAALSTLSAVGGREAPVILAITGTAGVGKTALAVQWAHQVAADFPDGQLHANLRGFGPFGAPAAPGEVLHRFLSALSVPAERIPANPDAQATLFRSMLAGKRMLVMLDNAGDAEQVRPLLPGTTGCLVVVTSRSRLTGLAVTDGALLVSLDVLSGAEAGQLLVRRLGWERIEAEPHAAAELTRLCARLPLALAVAAARAATRPQLRLAALAAELRDERGRLDALDAGDRATNVRAVFAWSCQQLGDPAARMFRLLGLHPGPDITGLAAASLAGVTPAAALRVLRELAEANLLAEHVPGRYACHDLLRAYAAEQVGSRDGEDTRHAAVRRMLDHYLYSAQAAGLLLSPFRDGVTLPPPPSAVVVERFGDSAAAQAWFEAGQHVLAAAVHLAAEVPSRGHAWRLAWALGAFLEWRGSWAEWEDVLAAALAAAQRDGDEAGQARTHLGSGLAQARLGRCAEARAHLRAALAMFRRSGDRTGQALAHHFLGVALERQGHHRAALGQSLRALKAFQAVGHSAGEAVTSNNAGWLHAHLGDYQQALICCRQALELHRGIGYRVGEAHTWDTLGYTHHQLGQHGRAISCYTRALSLFSEVGDDSFQVATLTSLGDSYRDAGDAASAGHAWRRALALLGAPHREEAGLLRAKLRGLQGAGDRAPAGSGSARRVSEAGPRRRQRGAG